MSPNRQRFYLIDPTHPFYRPLGVRLLIVAVVVFMTLWEFARGDGFWMVISLALAVYCANVLLVRYRLPENKPDASEES